MMKKIVYLTASLIIGLTGCNTQIDFSKIVPDNVDKFATGFISEIHKGNIDTCLTLVMPEMNNDNGKQFLTNTYTNIQSFSIDTFSIINARKTSMLGDNGFTNYGIEYEYKAGDQFIYFTFGIREQSGNLTVTSFDGRITDESLATLHTFDIKDKGFLHFLFLYLAILIPIFIIVTLIFAIRTKLTKKWLWIIGILFGFLKFSINWTTGQVGFSLINVSILGAGFSKSGNIAPWILSFSLPIVAIIFWYKRYWDIRESEAQKRLDERMKVQENQDKIE
jgi:hypothetical protein